MHIAILTPTIYRPDGLRRSLQTLKDTTSHLINHTIQPIVAAENDDIDALTIAYEFNAIFAICDKYRNGPAEGWNTALKAATVGYDAYFTGSDDIEYTPGWLDEVLRVLDEELNGSGLVGINDGRWGRDLVYKMCSTHYLMTRDFIIDYMGGVAAQPFYHADYTDMEANARARRVDKWAWAEKALVRHHWKGPHGDLGYENASSKRPLMKPLYQERLEKGFPDDFERILS